MCDRKAEFSKPSESQSENSAVDPTARFTDRVDNYVKARPGYPPEVASLLVQQCGLARNSTLVDVGCGTGLLAQVFCKFGCRVIGVEPNASMRAAGQQFLSCYPNFIMMDGQAESIPLPDSSVDFISAGQASHWFELDRARHEFIRVLKPNGWAVLVWNDRESTGSRFAEEYENLLVRFGIDYANVHERRNLSDASLERFFGSPAFTRETYPNMQQLDHENFVARVLSSSYMPPLGHARYPAMMLEIDRIFHSNQSSGTVAIRYATCVTYGRMT